MEASKKIQYYFDKNSQYNIPLDPTQNDITDLVRETFSLRQLIFFYEELDIMEETFFQEKMEEVFESYSLSQPEPFCMKDFMVFWVKQDRKLRIEYPQYDLIHKTATPFLSKIYKSSLTNLVEDQKQTNDSNRPLKNNTHSSQKSSLLHVEFNQSPSMEARQPYHMSKNNHSQPLFSTKRYFDDMIAVKKRLKSLFDFYNRKNHKNNTSLTFDQIHTQVFNFNLNVWMIFNRDFGFTKMLKKNQIHGMFKKYSDRQLMGFELFQVAIIEVFKKVFPHNKNQGWKVLCVNSDEQYHKKMKQLGMPYINSPIQEKQYSPTYSSHNPRKIIGQKHSAIKQNIKLIQNTPTKVIKTKVDPFARVHLQNPIHVQNDDQDRVFMKQYRLNNRNNKYVVNYQHKKLISSPSTGLLKRLDDRIKKYANF